MKSINLWIILGAISITLGLAGGAWAQMTDPDLAVSSNTAEPNEITNTATTDQSDDTADSPAEAADPSASDATDPTTTSDTDSDTEAPEVPIPSVQQDTNSKTTYSPLGVGPSQTIDDSKTD